MPETALVFVAQACDALEHAIALDEVTAIRDRAEALRLSSRQHRDSHAMQNRCAAIKIRAERRAGELLQEMEQNPSGRSSAFTLKEGGINHPQSHRWPTIAALPIEHCEAHLTPTLPANEALTSAALDRDA
jgi:hypothetical protein